MMKRSMFSASAAIAVTGGYRWHRRCFGRRSGGQGALRQSAGRHGLRLDRVLHRRECRRRCRPRLHAPRGSRRAVVRGILPQSAGRHRQRPDRLNRQASPSFLGALVFGVEADIEGTGMRDNFRCLIGYLPAQNLNYNQRLDWFGTVRGRIGIAERSGDELCHGGLGLWQRQDHAERRPPGRRGCSLPDQNRSGWVWGSGVEASLGGNWTGKIEYLYLNLGDRLDNFCAQRLCAVHEHRHARTHLPRRPELSHRRPGAPPTCRRRPRTGPASISAATIGSGLARDQDRLHLRRGRHLDRIVQSEPRRLHRRRPGRLQLAGRQLGAWSRGRHPGVEPARQPRLRADLQPAGRADYFRRL